MTKGNLHVAVIPDGARRWARKTGSGLREAYQLSFEILALLVKELHAGGCAEVSVYCLSRENLSRSPADLEAFYGSLNILTQMVNNLSSDGVCRSCRLVGDVNALPEAAQNALKGIDSNKSTSGGVKLNLLVCYDGWDEIRDAVRREGANVNLNSLWIRTRVDAIIRTGGGILLSGMLPLQSQYAQLIVTEMLFNELSRDEIQRLVKHAISVTHQFGR
jgi:Undecaprenyl pyrophosphate synthase